jgi:putative transcriptional regulator
MMTEAELLARDARRDIGAELLQAARELQTGKATRTTRFETMPDGSVRRTVTLADGHILKDEVQQSPQPAQADLIRHTPPSHAV